MGWPEDRDVKYGHNAAVEALGCAPKQFYFCEAVLLGRGGDDGLWMRLVGSGVSDLHRCGALVVAPEGIAYRELVLTRPLPRGAHLLSSTQPGERNSLVVTAAFVSAFIGYTRARRAKPVDWIWVARPDEITDGTVEPAVPSAHGPFVAVTITAKGATMTFGVRLSPHRPALLAAIRDLAGTGYSKAGPSAGPPRTDGVYVYGREQKHSPDIHVLLFDKQNAYFFATTDLETSVRQCRSGEGRWKAHPWSPQPVSFTIPDQSIEGLTVSESLLIYWHTQLKTTLFPAPYTEMRFISDAEIAGGWGRVTAPLQEAPWPAALAANGSITAPEIG